jgi:tungstate transport system substrate-binding protein
LRALIAVATFAAATAAGSYGRAEDRSIVVASTTSTQDSGLFGYLLPKFEEKTGIRVKVVALGTGRALDTGRRCDADVVFVHAKAQEEKFLKEGYGVERFPVMYNDFVLIGPKSDPAHITGMKNVAEALHKIKDAKAPFVSRGDRSGTHTAELKLWQEAGIEIEKDHDDWYKSIGQGMGAALNTAEASEAYVLADRGTWIYFKNKGDLGARARQQDHAAGHQSGAVDLQPHQDLEIMIQGDKRMFNQYGVMLVNPQKCPNVKAQLGQQFVDWVVSPEGQKTIADYKIDGEELFFPNANDPSN